MATPLSISGALTKRDARRLTNAIRGSTIGPTTLYYAGVTAPIIGAGMALLSQAALETLAIIAYGQPVTRAEIEAVRGVAVSKGTIDVLMEAGWVKIKGRRKTPGRPVTLGTTDKFLEHFGLESLDVLPGRAELEAEGLLTDVIPDGFFC